MKRYSIKFNISNESKSFMGWGTVGVKNAKKKVLQKNKSPRTVEF